MKQLVATALALLALCVSPFAVAERASPRPAQLSDANDVRVIVKFKQGGSSLRAHALAANASAADAARVLADRAATLGSRHGLMLRAGAAVGDRAQVVQADAAHGLDARALASRLAADPDVEYAEPDRRMRRVALPNDPRFSTVGGSGPAVGQWYLRAPAGGVQSPINAAAAWDVHTGNHGVIVAVLDTGVRPNHPDLAGKLIGGYDFISDALVANDGNVRDSDPADPGDWITSADAATTTFTDCEVSDSSWHGTQVAGIVAAATNNGIGMAGAGGHVRVMPVRVLGKCFGYTSDIAAAMRWAVGLAVSGVPTNTNPAKVINLSLGSDGACSTTEQQAVDAVLAAGAVVVAAAGNSAGHPAGSPANCNGVIGVAALRHVGTKVGFSDLGASLKIAAPGGNCVNIGANEACLYPILTTIDSGTKGPVSPTYSDSFNASVGTSFSSPLVAGTAALMFSVDAALTPSQVLATLQSTARPFPSSGVPDDPTSGPVPTCQAPGGFDQLQCYCTTSTCGAGMLDAHAAVRAVLGSAPALQPNVAASPAAPEAGATVTLSSAGSQVPGGRSIVVRRWTLVDGGGIASAFGGADDGETATLTPSGAGRVVVQLTLVDDRGLATATDFALVVSAASGGGGGGGSGGGGGGGGGALSWPWLAGLLLAVLALVVPLSRRR
ncbi:MAG: S8 family serine peptidase [Pseudomonadota bacterium]